MKNMKNSSSSSSSGTSILGLLGIVFVVLKLTNVINWSWWYVTMPFWGGLALLLVVGIIWLPFLLIKKSSNNKKSTIKRMESTIKKSVFQERLEKMAEERKYNKN